jgi:gliding motility-associated lipoprotein GldH
MPFSYFSTNFNLQIMKKTAILLLVLFVILSCDKKQVYRNFENEITAQRWSESDVKIHEFEILDDDKSYNVFIEISHVIGTEMNEFPVEVKLQKSENIPYLKTVIINLNDKDCLGDICDSKILVFENVSYKKGKYKVSFSPKSNYGFVPNIIGVGLTVEIKE